jgi:DNA-binding NarL/FixJ family response regulator
MDIPSPIGTVSEVWILGRHPLAADYLLMLLGNDPSIKAQWIRDDLAANVDPGSNPALIVDHAAIDVPSLEYIRRLNSKRDCLRYILLHHELDVHMMLRLLSLGVRGFVPYEQVSGVLHLAIRTVCSGGMWVDSGILQKQLQLKKRERTCLGATPEPLTAREDEIMALARQRLSNKEIASILSIQVSTVKFHLSNIFSKLQITGRSDLWRHSSADLFGAGPSLGSAGAFQGRCTLPEHG